MKLSTVASITVGGVVSVGLAGVALLLLMMYYSDKFELECRALRRDCGQICANTFIGAAEQKTMMNCFRACKSNYQHCTSRSMWNRED